MQSIHRLLHVLAQCRLGCRQALFQPPAALAMGYTVLPVASQRLVVRTYADPTFTIEYTESTDTITNALHLLRTSALLNEGNARKG